MQHIPSTVSRTTSCAWLCVWWCIVSQFISSMTHPARYAWGTPRQKEYRKAHRDTRANSYIGPSETSANTKQIELAENPFLYLPEAALKELLNGMTVWQHHRGSSLTDETAKHCNVSSKCHNTHLIDKASLRPSRNCKARLIGVFSIA